MNKIFMIMLFVVASCAHAEYGKHQGGSGNVEGGKLVIVGDDIFAHKKQYKGLTQKYNITGEPVISNIEKRFTGWTVANKSAAGKRVAQATSSDASGADAVVLACGLGDLLAGTSPASFESSYKKAVSVLKSGGGKVYLANLSPVQMWYKDYAKVSKNFAAYQKVIADVAREEGVTLIDLFEVNAENPKYFVDGAIPVLYGSQFIADRIYEVVTGDVAATMPWIFTDNMVLQRGKPLPVFGRGKPGTKVSASFGGDSASGKVDSNGFWMVKLGERDADASGKTLTVKVGGKAFSYKNVVVGDVWIAAGQSNMASVPMKKCVGAKAEKASFPSGGYKNIRLLRLTSASACAKKRFNWSDKLGREEMPLFKYYSAAEGGWQPADSYNRAAAFSGVAWFFTKQVHLDYKVPVGIIQSCIGGTSIESYIPHKQFFTEKEIISQVGSGDKQRGGMMSWVNDPKGANWAQEVAALQRSGLNRNDVPLAFHPMEHSFLYKSGIQPFIPFAVKGAIWYQGESNANTGLSTGGPPTPRERNIAQYRALVRGWHQAWQEASGDAERDQFAFLIVQLPVIGTRPAWPFYRDSQFKFWQDKNDGIDNVGLAVTLEHGDGGGNVHPYAKGPVGRRLARMAHRYAYGEMDYFYSGPVATGIEVRGNTIAVKFDPETLGDGLQALEQGSELKYYEISDKTGNFVLAQAKISGSELILSAKGVKVPVAVRYFWDDNPLGRKVAAGAKHILASSRDGVTLPASPFIFGEDNIEVYEGDEVPAGFIEAWEASSTQMPKGWIMNNKGNIVNKTVDVGDGNRGLKIVTTKGPSNSYVDVVGGSLWKSKISKGSFTLETRLKIEAGSSFIAPHNKDSAEVSVATPTAIKFGGKSYDSDNSSDFVTFRYVFDAGDKSLNLYRNGEQLAQTTCKRGSKNCRIFIGDGSGRVTANMTIDYIRYAAKPLKPGMDTPQKVTGEIVEDSGSMLCIKLTATDGIPLQLSSIGCTVPDSVKKQFGKSWSNFKVFYGIDSERGKARELKGVSADLSDVALYGGFNCEFKHTDVKPGTSYLWITADFTGSDESAKSVDPNCETIGLMRDGKPAKAIKPTGQ